VTRYILRRLLASIPVVLGVTFATFTLLHVTSGSWVPGLELNPLLTPDDITRLRKNLGLDDPFLVQYFRWLSGLAHFDLGTSMVDGTSVSANILERLPNTLLLTVTGLVLGVALSIPFGVISARRRGRWADHVLTFFSVIGVSIPSFWLGLLMVLLFSISFQQWGLPWLPSSSATSAINGGDAIDRVKHLIMPALCLAFLHLAIWSRFIRSSMVEVLTQDYVRTARSKGLSESIVTYRHAFRNAALPLVTLLGLELPALVGGGAIVEIVFAWPGIGRLAVDRALRFDYTMVLGLTTFASMLVVLGNLLSDLLYAVLDPRIRYR